MRTFFLGLIFLTSIPLIAQQSYHKTLILMGSRFDITVVAENPIQAKEWIDMAIAEISRIEKLISSWDPNSQTAKININAGIQPVEVDRELFDLIARAQVISRLTDGAFDISYASMDKIWRFDGSMKKMPTAAQVHESIKKVGHQYILLDNTQQTVYLKHRGMKIAFGAIGKGYAADKAKQLLIQKGAPGGIINASGDMNTWGKKPDGTDWTVAITNPMNKNNVFALLPLKQGAVVTSGDYEKYVEFNGIRYAHIINPKTGYPATGLVSVTVFATSAELADALATSVFVMGKDTGLDLINQMPDVECIIIDDQGNIYPSKHIKIKKAPNGI